MRWVPQCSKSSENPSRSDRGIILGTGIPNNHLITQRRGPSEWSSCGIAIVGIAACPPGLNSARAAAACRSVRDAVMQVSLRLQVCQGRGDAGQSEIAGLSRAPQFAISTAHASASSNARPQQFLAGHHHGSVASNRDPWLRRRSDEWSPKYLSKRNQLSVYL